MAEEDIALRVSIKDRAIAARDMGGLKKDVAGIGDTAHTSGLKADKSTRGWTNLGGGLRTVARRAAVVGGALVVAGAGAAKGLYSIGSTFDDVSDTIRVGTGATGKHLAALEASAKKVGRSVPAAFSDIGPVVADVNTRLGLTGPTLEKVSSQILETGRMTGQAIDINAVSGAFNAFQVQGDKTAGAMDTLYQVSQATGLGINELATSVSKNGAALKGFGFSLEESASWIGTLDKAGLDGNKTLGTLSRAMSTFAKDGKDPQEALRGTVDRIEQLTKAGKDAAAINLAGEVFGTRGATQFVGAIKAGKVNLDALTKSTGATSDKILKAGRDTADFGEHWQKFKNRALIQLEPVAKRVFDALGDGMKILNKDVVPAVRTFIGQMRSGEGAGGEFADAMRTAGSVLKKIGSGLVSVGGFLLRHKDLVAGIVIAYGAWRTISAVINAVKVAQMAYTAITYGAAGATYAQGAALVIYSAVMKVVTVATKAWAVVQWLLNAAMSANPIGLAVIALAALAAGLVYAWKHSETFRAIVTGAFNAVKTAVMFVWNWIKNNWPLLLAILTGPIGLAVLVIAKNWDRIKAGAGAVKDWIVDKFDAVVGFFRGLPSRIGRAVSGLFDGIKEAFRGAINFVIDGWNGLSFSIPGFDPPGPGSIPGVTISTPNVPRLAQGGIVQAQPGGIMANIGEGRYDEAVVPLNGTQYLIDRTGVTPLPQPAPLPAAGAADMPDLGHGEALGWGGTLHVHVEIDGREVGEAVLDNFDDRAARR